MSQGVSASNGASLGHKSTQMKMGCVCMDRISNVACRPPRLPKCQGSSRKALVAGKVYAVFYLDRWINPVNNLTV